MRKCAESPELTNQPIGRPALLHWEEEVNAMSLLIVNITTRVVCVTLFDQWATFNEVTYQNIPQNGTGVVAEIQCVAYLCVESGVLCVCYTKGQIKKSVWFLSHPKKYIGRVGRNLFLKFSFFNSHDSLELDGFSKSLPCCKCFWMQKLYFCSSRYWW